MKVFTLKYINNMSVTPPDIETLLKQLSDKHPDAMVKWAREDKRLSELPLIELIEEIVGSSEGESLAVMELIDRACPNWTELIAGD